MERSIEFIISILATVKAGAAYLPLDTSYPKDRLEFILKDAKALHLITKSEYCTFFDSFTGDVICWDDEMIQKQKTNNPQNVNKSTDMVYIIYTSGSTGKPKGCILMHQNLLNFCYDHIHTLKLDQSSRILSMASISFDVCTDEIWLAMTSGACLVIPSEHIRKDPLLLIDFIESMEITVACFTPMYLKMIPKQPIRGLKVIEIAGDVCDYETMAYWSKHVTFFNGYGPTETNYATVKKWTEYDLAQNIGKPMYNCKCYILDEYLKPVPIGKFFSP
jgi:non-ribosomal peptide synthetase component F